MSAVGSYNILSIADDARWLSVKKYLMTTWVILWVHKVSSFLIAKYMNDYLCTDE